MNVPPHARAALLFNFGYVHAFTRDMEIFSNLPHDNSVLEKSNFEQGRCFSLRCLEIAYHTIVYIHISQGCENGLYGAGDGRNGFIIFLACQGDAYQVCLTRPEISGNPPG